MLRRPTKRTAVLAVVGASVLALNALPIRADSSQPVPVAAPIATYADLAALADSATLVLKVQIRKLAPVEPARAPDVRPGWVRLYIEAEPQGVLLGPQVLPPLLQYLIDVPLDARGRPPELKRHVELIFARSATDTTRLQLVGSDGQLPWDADLEARTRKVLAQLAAPDAPGRVTGVREAMYVPGTLAGEGETQIFLSTQNGSPASVTVIHQPGQAPRWSASFSEVVDATGVPPPAETLAWYRLACALPDVLPDSVNVSEAAADKDQAASDYRLVRAGLGACVRLRP